MTTDRNINSGGTAPQGVQTEDGKSLSSNSHMFSIRPFFWATDRRRLAAYLKAYEAEVDELSRAAPSETNIWRNAAKRLVDQAKDELDRRNIYAGWASYNAAKRLEVLGLEDDEIRVLGDGLILEAKSKLGESWRFSAIEAIVAQERAISTGPADFQPQDMDPAVALDAQRAAPRVVSMPTLTAPLLRLAMELRDESLQNNYWKFHHLRRQLRILAAGLLGTLLIIVPIVALRPNVLWDPMSSSRGALWVLVGCFGVLGGCLSAFRTYTPGSLNVRIPEMFSNAIITVLRPLVGGAAGLVSFAFLASGAVRFGSDVGAVALSVAFVAGFSERFILGVVESIGGR